MNLDELQSIQSRERQATSLQHLRSSFYQDAGEFIRELVRERDRAAERADDPFSSDEVRQLTDDIETAKSTVEAIYERRVGKVVKTASIAAAGMPADDEGLTEEEQRLFETLVDRIEQNREHVLEGVLTEDGSGISCTREGGAHGSAAETAPDADAEAAPEAHTDRETTIDAEPDAAAELGLDSSPDDTTSSDGAIDAAAMMGDGAEPDGDPSIDRSQPDPSDSADVRASGESEAETDSPIERTTVRITSDVGEVFGVDERSYDLSADDVVQLPVENAGPLVERDAAERLD